MIAKSEREQIIALINREVVPAIGCTEPIAVALCVAKATETLGKRPEKIKALLRNETKYTEAFLETLNMQSFSM